VKRGEDWTAERLIEVLRLEPHPEEGGFFRETYRSGANFEPGAAFDGARSVGTAIYYLLTADTWSALHRLPGDEIFHFYLGDPVEMLMLHPDGRDEVITLGHDVRTMHVQHVVRGNTWQGSRLVDGGRFALLGTTMAPGFDYRDYEKGTTSLMTDYPSRRMMIEALLPASRSG
jgi:predicted cupin superfamily sugar epimerase